MHAQKRPLEFFLSSLEVILLGYIVGLVPLLSSVIFIMAEILLFFHRACFNDAGFYYAVVCLNKRRIRHLMQNVRTQECLMTGPFNPSKPVVLPTL
uniref:Uncharacterized protein n=1 Tax=Anguilla anguilla TaxID=7936 RepID=A0A0E9XW25_ANGAN